MHQLVSGFPSQEGSLQVAGIATLVSVLVEAPSFARIHPAGSRLDYANVAASSGRALSPALGVDALVTGNFTSLGLSVCSPLTFICPPQWRLLLSPSSNFVL